MGKQRARTVMLDPALFADKTGLKQRQIQPFRDRLRDTAVVAIWLLIAPAVEMDVGNCERPCSVFDKGRS